ncbi:MAG: glycosyltransferase, partial [Hyphomonadaceae bacterium]|nr:glycosyltransferase [Hyphomonadaceae bacterium]
MSQTITMERTTPHAGVAATGARVDVIMPMWNAAETVEAALRALQAQTMPDWRALVVDNGSADDGPARVRTLAASDSRIVLLSEAARGVSQARNRGLHGSSAEWLLFLDADDFIAPRHLERLLSVAETEPGVCAVASGAARSTPDGRIWARTEPEFSDPFDTFGQMGVLFPIHSCIWRRNLVLAQGGFRTDLAIAEDWDLWIRMARAGLVAR